MREYAATFEFTSLRKFSWIDCIFFDPSRRDQGKRTVKIEEYEPPLSFISELGIFLQRINDIENFSLNIKRNLLNEDRFSDIYSKRLTLINLNEIIVKNKNLLLLREKAYSPLNNILYVNKYIKALFENNVIDSEISYLKEKEKNICQKIYSSKMLSLLTKIQIIFIFKLYSKKLNKYDFNLYF